MINIISSILRDLTVFQKVLDSFPIAGRPLSNCHDMGNRVKGAPEICDQIYKISIMWENGWMDG
jgi:hypothetical protein